MISSLARAITSPVSGAITLRARILPTSTSNGTSIRSRLAAAMSRMCLAVMRLSLATISLPSSPTMSSLATSPFRRSATTFWNTPFLVRKKVSQL
ncbi:hypothetical protein D3C72_2255300 [compost metagenome]